VLRTRAVDVSLCEAVLPPEVLRLPEELCRAVLGRAVPCRAGLGWAGEFVLSWRAASGERTGHDRHHGDRVGAGARRGAADDAVGRISECPGLDPDLLALLQVTVELELEDVGVTYRPGIG